MQASNFTLWDADRNTTTVKDMAADPESIEGVAERLEITRLALNFPTQVAFAATIPGMTPQKWGNYVQRRDKIPVDTALFLCQRYRLSLDWIYRGLKDALPLRLVQEIEKIEAARAVPSPRRSLKRK